MVPSTGRLLPATFTTGAVMAGRTMPISDCSSLVVLASERLARKPVSSPSAMAATPASTSTPNARRSHSPAPSDCFMAVKMRPPTRSASASEVAAPAA